MNSSLLLISGWAHTTESMKPLNDVFSTLFDINILSASDALQQKTLTEYDYIIGVSVGAIVALEKLPISCKKLILLSGTACFCNKQDYRYGTNERILIRMQNQLKKNRENVLSAFFKNAHAPQSPMKDNVDINISDEDLYTGLEYMRSIDLRERVSHIQIPTLIIHGSEDHIIPYSAAEWLHAHMPKSELACLEGLGHMILKHSPKDAIERMERFLT